MLPTSFPTLPSSSSSASSTKNAVTISISWYNQRIIQSDSNAIQIHMRWSSCHVIHNPSTYSSFIFNIFGIIKTSPYNCCNSSLLLLLSLKICLQRITPTLTAERQPQIYRSRKYWYKYNFHTHKSSSSNINVVEYPWTPSIKPLWRSLYYLGKSIFCVILISLTIYISKENDSTSVQKLQN